MFDSSSFTSDCFFNSKNAVPSFRLTVSKYQTFFCVFNNCLRICCISRSFASINASFILQFLHWSFGMVGETSCELRTIRSLLSTIAIVDEISAPIWSLLLTISIVDGISSPIWSLSLTASAFPMFERGDNPFLVGIASILNADLFVLAKHSVSK